MVGKGAFGKVRIVEKKDTGLTFALKYIRKEEGIFPVFLGWGHVGADDFSDQIGKRTEYYS